MSPIIKFMSIMGSFDRHGGEWVGLSTALTLLLFFLQSIGVPVIVPTWWTGVGGVYSIILGCFVVSKSGGYYIDSKYNSQQGDKPVVTK